MSSGNAALPLKFIYFTGGWVVHGVSLAWKVVKDELIRDFDIQYSDDGSNFETIAIKYRDDIQSEDTDSWLYEYRDLVSRHVKRTYRIRLNDLNGKYIYTEIIK